MFPVLYLREFWERDFAVIKFGAWMLCAPMPRKLFRQLGTTIVQWLAAERQECHMAGLLDSCCNHALVLRTGAGLAARSDLAFFGYIFAEQVGLFVINDQ